MSIPLSPIGPLDADIPILFDFSAGGTRAPGALAVGDSISSIIGVTATPAGLTIGATPTIVAGNRAACAVQAIITPGTLGTTYLVTAKILSVQGLSLGRSITIPVAIL